MDSTVIRIPPHDPYIGTLDNGLQVLLKEIPGAPIVSLQVWVRCGSIHEDRHLGAGLSHLLEHMLFNGTEKRGARQVSEEVQAAGAYINAFTSFDRTVYWIETPPSGLSQCIDILGDMVLHATLPEEEFRKELDVIRREMTMGDDSPSSLVSKLLFQTAFLQHPCRHPIIGHRQVFDRTQYQELVDFYHRQYIPNNLFLVAAGPFENNLLLDEIQKHFGSALQGPVPPIVIPQEPPQEGHRILHHAGSTQHSQLRLGWHGPSATHPDASRLDLISSILGSGRSSRLFHRLREELGLVHSIGAYVHAMNDSGLFVIGAETDPEKRLPTETAIEEEIAAFIEKGPADGELEKAVKSALSESLKSLTTTRGQASDIGSSWLLTGTADFTGQYLRQLQSVTGDDLRTTAARYLLPSRKTTVSVNPQETERAELLIRKVPAAKLDTQRISLPNGLTLLVRADSSLPLVTAHCAFRSGLLVEPVGKAGLTRLASELLTKDTRTRSTAAVASAIESVGGNLASFSGFNSIGITADVMSPDWKLAVELLGQSALEPLFLETSLEREREVLLADIRSEKDRPLTEALKIMRESLFPQHPYRFPLNGTAESVRSLTPSDCRALRELSLSGANGVIALYGDLDPKAVRDEVERWFGELPAGNRAFRNTPPAPLITSPSRVIASSSKEQAIVVIGFPGCSLSSDDALILELITDGCSDMSSRLFVKVREELGAAYSVGASRMHGFCGGTFFLYASTSPHQIDVVEKALNEEIERLKTEGFRDEELVPIKRSWHGSHLNRLQTVSAQARIHTLDELYDFGWNHSAVLPQRVDQITTQDIIEISRKYFQEDRKVTVILSPEKKEASAPGKARKSRQ